jgi:serine phosphatase RsbU (regulator of sigma subunit)
MFGLLTTALTSRMPPARAVPFLMLLAGAYFVANGLLFYDRLNIVISAAAPMVAIAACWSACMIVRLILEGLERIRREKAAAIIDHEINLARQVQQALIPKQLTILTNIESHGWTLAATTTGGDCFDLWKLADGRLGILVADASGHGLGPSILVTEVRALVRGLCDLYEEPQKLLERVNQRLASDLDGSKFVTAFVAFVTEDGKLSWGSAGHGPMLLSPAVDGDPKELEATGLPLGVSDDWFGEPTVPAVQLEPGGWLMVVSDGIFEAPNPSGEQFEITRVKQLARNLRQTTCEQMVLTLRQAVHRWQAKDEPVDDQTIVLIRRSAVPAPVGEVAPSAAEGSAQLAGADESAAVAG